MLRSIVRSLLVLVTLVSAAEAQTPSPFARFERTDLIKAFKESWALVIGNAEYTGGWNKLPGVRDDVPAVVAALERNGFNVIVHRNLTRAQMEAAFSEFRARHGNYDDRDNRLLIYFAGHGYTMKPTYGGDAVGYIVGVDAADPRKDPSRFNDGALDMQFIEVYAKQLQARHVLFMFDACFAGSIFGVTRGSDDAVVNYKVRTPVRQFLTSGSANEEVPDVSEFRRAFVRVLEGEQQYDPNGDGFLTGTELGMFLEDEVTRSNRSQHPQSGKLNTPAELREGDFVFELKYAQPKNQLADAAPTIQVAIKASSPDAPNYDREAEAKWLPEYARGYALVSENKLDEALAVLENAKRMMPDRPETHAVLAHIYALRKQYDKAEVAYRAAIAGYNGPLHNIFNADVLHDWARYGEEATIRLGDLYAAHGVDAFDAKHYLAAANLFKKQVAVNPHSRNARFDVANALYAEKLRLEETKELVSYDMMRQMSHSAEASLAADPTLGYMMLVAVQGYRALADMTQSATQKENYERKIADLMDRYNNSVIEVNKVSIAETEGRATIEAEVQQVGPSTKALDVALQMNLIGVDGRVVGSTVLTFMSAASSSATRDAPSPVGVQTQVVETTGPVAGWSYTVKLK